MIDQLAWVTWMMRSVRTRLTTATWPSCITPERLNTSTEPAWGAWPVAYFPSAWFHQVQASPNSWMPENMRAKVAHCQAVSAWAAPPADRAKAPATIIAPKVALARANIPEMNSAPAMGCTKANFRRQEKPKNVNGAFLEEKSCESFAG